MNTKLYVFLMGNEIHIYYDDLSISQLTLRCHTEAKTCMKDCNLVITLFTVKMEDMSSLLETAMRSNARQQFKLNLIRKEIIWRTKQV